MNQFLEQSTFVFKYDVSGGDSGTTATTVTLGSLPDDFVITQAWIHVLTTFTSATDAATIALGHTGSVSAFDAAIAISNGGNPWDAAAPRVSDGAADGLVANFITAGAGDSIIATLGGAEDVTAGKLLLVVKGYRAL